MSLSLNETHKLIKEAGRGAGLSWGEADELAQAAVWLEVAGFPGCRTAQCVLDEIDAVCAPVVTSTEAGWHFTSAGAEGTLNSLLVAIGVRDIALPAAVSPGSFPTVNVIGVRWPLLFLGAMGKLVPGRGDQMLLRMTDVKGELRHEVTIRASGVWSDWDGSWSDASSPQTYTIALTREVEFARGDASRCVWSQDLHIAATETGLSPDPQALKFLRRYARVCLVPATEESRLKGAGAGTVDRD